MVESQHFCLRWNNYQSSITSAFENLRDDEDFVDVTIACEGKSLKAHRVVLSACSPYFRELLKSTPCKHPVIVLQDVAFADLDALVEFIYHGEVNVHQRNLTSFLKTAEVLRVSGLTQQADSREDGLLSQLSSANPRNICQDPLFNMSPSGRSPPAASSPLHTPPHNNNNNNSSSNNNNPVNNNCNSPSGPLSNIGVNHLLRRAAVAAEVSKRLQRNSLPTPPISNESNEQVENANPMKRPRSINNNSENGPVTNSHGDWDREREQWDRECETDINANPADLTNHQLTPTDFSAKNSFRKIELERFDRERDRDRDREKDRERERSRSPSSRPAEKVKAEPVEVTCGATVDLENSGDSVEAFNERRHRKQNALVQGPPSTSSTGEHDDMDSSMQSPHNSSFLSVAESKLFAAAGTFNFSMAALAADSALAGMALPGNTEGLAGTSTQEHEGRGCWGEARSGPGQGPTGPYCPICRKSFSRAWSLHRHMSDTHFYVPQSFECEVCRRTYRSRNSLVSHKSQYHGGLAGIRAMEEEQRASGALNNNLPPMTDADMMLELVRKQQQQQQQFKSWDRDCEPVVLEVGVKAEQH